jgi:hypothetical protein
MMINDFLVFIDEVFHDDQDILQMEKFIDNCFSWGVVNTQHVVNRKKWFSTIELIQLGTCSIIVVNNVIIWVVDKAHV